MKGDIDAYHDPIDMLHDATQYLAYVRDRCCWRIGISPFSLSWIRVLTAAEC